MEKVIQNLFPCQGDDSFIYSCFLFTNFVLKSFDLVKFVFLLVGNASRYLM